MTIPVQYCQETRTGNGNENGIGNGVGNGNGKVPAVPVMLKSYGWVAHVILVSALGPNPSFSGDS